MTNRPYSCVSCGTFDYPQSIKDEILKTCPLCGSECSINFSGLKDSLVFDLPAFNDIEVNSPDWKKKGRAAVLEPMEILKKHPLEIIGKQVRKIMWPDEEPQ